MNAVDVFSTASPVMPVLEIPSVDKALPLAEALWAGGVRTMEITLRTESGIQAIEAVAKALPEMLVGAGTISNPEELQRVVDAGARFALSPGFTHELASASQSSSIPWVPGVATAAEIMQAKNYGLIAMKLFPATVVGGVSALKAFAGPFADVRFCPTGGINDANYHEFLALDNVLCVGASWLAPAALIAEGNWDEITRRGLAVTAPSN